MGFRTLGFALVFAAEMLACSAVYPELQAPFRTARGNEAEPPPPGLKWIAFKGATVPETTRDGRRWGGDLTKGGPDPYAILYVNGKPLIKTPTHPNTLQPTWPDGPAGNFHIDPNDRFRVELWDSNPINDHPIGIREFKELTEDEERRGEIDLECDTGARVRVALEPAHARLGLGFYYELRVGEVFVTRVYKESPAGRSGLKPGDQILTLENRPVAEMKKGEVQSLINTPHLEGLPAKIRHAGGQEATVTLKEGAIYPFYSEIGTFR
ncbi:MAG: PDZ domain-containing protein [Polyangiaceae bacterium]